MSGAIAQHVMYAPRLRVGATQTRVLELLDATTEVATGDGTYTLRAPNGDAVSGCEGLTVTAGSVSVPVPSGLTLGPGYVEEWTTTVDGVDSTRTIDVVVYTWTLGRNEVLCAALHATQRYPFLTEMYASGQTSWDVHARIGTARVMADLDQRLVHYGGAPVARTALFFPALDATCAEIFRALGAYGDLQRLAMAELHEAAYASWWANLKVPVDTDGDGAADTQRAPAPSTGSL